MSCSTYMVPALTYGNEVVCKLIVPDGLFWEGGGGGGGGG